MNYKPLTFQQKFGLFTEQWQPKVIAEDERLSVQGREGAGRLHLAHRETDETFIVIGGDLRIDFQDAAVHVSTGEMFVVPRGVKHKPYAEQEVKSF